MLHSNAAAGGMVADMLAAKAGEGAGELFLRGVLCNVLVCLAIWGANRLRSEAGKAIVIFWAIFAFISSGFEHVVANMTTFSLGLFSGEELTTWGEFGRNMLFVGTGNLVGGAVVVGLGYLVASGWFSSPSAVAAGVGVRGGADEGGADRGRAGGDGGVTRAGAEEPGSPVPAPEADEAHERVTAPR